jgi:hypothetical protein
MAEQGQPGQFLLDAADAFDGLVRVVARVLPGRWYLGREDVEVSARLEAVLAARDAMDAARDLDLAVGRMGHTDLVDGHADHARAVLFGQIDPR